MSEQNVYVDKESAVVTEKMPSCDNMPTEKRAKGHEDPIKYQEKVIPFGSKFETIPNKSRISAEIIENTGNLPSLSSKLLLGAYFYLNYTWRRNYLKNL